jgi:metal-sulfur cluster biosynthetic enzyme
VPPDVSAGWVNAEEHVGRSEDVWRQLHTVVDPELDEPVTDMGFISRAEVDASDCVHVDFRLPTYWCAANFAFMMADDMRTALRALPWVKDTRIVLGDHMYASAINHGVNQGLSFQETFAGEANGDLDELRRTFLVKAFQRRQEALINHLLQAGYDPHHVVGLCIGDLPALQIDAAGHKLVERYLERRDVISAGVAGAHAFVSCEGIRLAAADLRSYLTGLRRVRANAEFNGALCRGLLEVRFDMTTPLIRQSEASCLPREVTTQD